MHFTPSQGSGPTVRPASANLGFILPTTTRSRGPTVWYLPEKIGFPGLGNQSVPAIPRHSQEDRVCSGPCAPLVGVSLSTSLFLLWLTVPRLLLARRAEPTIRGSVLASRTDHPRVGSAGSAGGTDHPRVGSARTDQPRVGSAGSAGGTGPRRVGSARADPPFIEERAPEGQRPRLRGQAREQLYTHATPRTARSGRGFRRYSYSRFRPLFHPRPPY